MPPDLLTVANGAVQSEASANGIVLERVGGVVTMCDRPPPGGEPLWRVSDETRDIRSSASRGHKMLQQAAPANYPA